MSTQSQFDTFNKYYTVKFSSTVSSLLSGILGIGIFLVAYNYGRLLLSFGVSNVIGQIDFWCRIIILFAIIAYVCYDYLAYKIHFDVQSKIVEKEGLVVHKINTVKPIALFLLDILRIIISAWIIAFSAISEIGRTDLLSLEKDEKVSLLKSILYIDFELFQTLFFLFGFWHFILIFWYIINGVLKGFSLKFHIIGTLVNFIILVATLFLNSYYANFQIIKYFCCIYIIIYVSWIYTKRLSRFIANDMLISDEY